MNHLKPDLVAITGDLVDGGVPELGGQVAPLRRLRSRHGSYFVTGNHEYYSGVEPWLVELAGLGIRRPVGNHARAPDHCRAGDC